MIGLEGLLSTSVSAAPTFGIYLYGWYDPPKWQAHKHLHVPRIGYYDFKRSARH